MSSCIRDKQLDSSWWCRGEQPVHLAYDTSSPGIGAHAGSFRHFSAWNRSTICSRKSCSISATKRKKRGTRGPELLLWVGAAGLTEFNLLGFVVESVVRQCRQDTRNMEGYMVCFDCMCQIAQPPSFVRLPRLWPLGMAPPEKTQFHSLNISRAIIAADTHRPRPSIINVQRSSSRSQYQPTYSPTNSLPQAILVYPITHPLL